MSVTNKDLYEAMEKIRKELEEDLKELDTKVDKTFTKIEAFIPVKNVVYGMVSLILTAVVVALIGLVIVK